MDIDINVLQTDIDNGSRQSCQYCPVALAIVRALSVPDLRILVSPNYVGFYPKNSNRPDDRLGKVFLPVFVSKWIVQFDSNDYPLCKPFAFRLIISDDLFAEFEKLKIATTDTEWLLKHRSRLCPIHGGKIHESVVKATYWCASCKRIWKLQRRHAGPIAKTDWKYATV
jgi:hypothetical protein